MDPTFKAQLRDFLLSDDIREAAGDELHAKLLELVPESTLEPRVVHVEGAIEEAPDLDEKGKPIKLHGIAQRTRTYAGPLSCADCGSGLTSRGHDMVCPRLPRTIVLRGCHDGCAVFCGSADR